MSGGGCRLVFLAFYPVCELEEDVTHDRFSATPFVADFLQVPKHSIATLYMIVGANFAASG